MFAAEQTIGGGGGSDGGLGGDGLGGLGGGYETFVAWISAMSNMGVNTLERSLSGLHVYELAEPYADASNSFQNTHVVDVVWQFSESSGGLGEYASLSGAT